PPEGEPRRSRSCVEEGGRRPHQSPSVERRKFLETPKSARPIPNSASVAGSGVPYTAWREAESPVVTNCWPAVLKKMFESGCITEGSPETAKPRPIARPKKLSESAVKSIE